MWTGRIKCGLQIFRYFSAKTNPETSVLGHEKPKPQPNSKFHNRPILGKIIPYPGTSATFGQNTFYLAPFYSQFYRTSKNTFWLIGVLNMYVLVLRAWINYVLIHQRIVLLQIHMYWSYGTGFPYQRQYTFDWILCILCIFSCVFECVLQIRDCQFKFK